MLNGIGVGRTYGARHLALQSCACLAVRVERIYIHTIRQAKRIVTAVFGFTMLACGIAMLFLPGPGWLIILLGLSVLSAEFAWARRLLRRLREKGREIKIQTLRPSKKA